MVTTFMKVMANRSILDYSHRLYGHSMQKNALT